MGTESGCLRSRCIEWRTARGLEHRRVVERGEDVEAPGDLLGRDLPQQGVHHGLALVLVAMRAAAEHDADDSLNGVFAHMLLPVFPDLYFFVLRG